MTNLNDLNILVTRPSPAGEMLCQQIKTHGGWAIHFPTMAFAPPINQEAFLHSIHQLGKQDWLIFISPQAVYASIATIRREWPQFPPQVKFAAIGESTANALLKAGYLVEAYPETSWDSEGLLAMPVFQRVAKQKIAIVRGEGGRDVLEKVLIERGANVMAVIAYQRILPEIIDTSALNLLKQNQIDVIICTSFEGVKNLKTIVGQDGWPYLRFIPLLVVSERIKILAHDLGFQTIWIANNASHEAIINVLAKKKG